MRRGILIFFFFIFSFSLFASLSDDYFVELGKVYLQQGRFEDAELEFKKALKINPSNEEVKRYLKKIRNKKIKEALDLFSYKKKREEEKTFDIKISGQYQLSFGIEKDNFLWREANYDLNEENWRIFSDTVHNRRENTFDPAIFSQLRFEVDASQKDIFGFHLNVDISPWSFIGKTNKVTIAGIGGDSAQVELKYWASSRYTINEAVYTLDYGDSFALPEIKVVDGRTSSTTITSTFGNIFIIPEMDIDREFQPIRELWFDYVAENFHFRLFPIAYQDQALTSDDPLMLSNRMVYWEESPWLDEWRPGNLNTGTLPVDFSRGEWDDTLSFFARDSTGTRLYSLRGFAFDYDFGGTSLEATIASPKGPWRDYDSVNSVEGAMRVKHHIQKDLMVGGVYTFKMGYDEGRRDALNHVVGLDLDYDLTPMINLKAEVATSRSKQDIRSDYDKKLRGNAWQVVVTAGKGGGRKKEADYKIRLTYTHMDEGFESALSSFRETRDDIFWSRHLTFREPFKYYYAGLYQPTLTWDDIKVFRIGDGIDYGRDVINFRLEWENLFKNRLDGLFDIRNVHNVNGKYIENVTRLEATYRLHPKLTTKILGVYHDLPKTKGGIDPFVIDADTGDYYQNSSVEDGEDPSLKTVSLGAKYDFFDWLNLSFVWERSNDTTLAYDNFPRGLFNWTSFSTYQEYGNTYRKEIFGLYNTSAFPLPPYPYFDIFKVGLGIKPKDNLEIYLDYTRNEYEWIQLIDDNANHIGLEIGCFPLDKLGFYIRYMYTRAKDISELNDNGIATERSYHNVFSEIRLRYKKDEELVFQYGVGGMVGIDAPTYTPFGGGTPVLDIQHIFRIYYRKKF